MQQGDYVVVLDADEVVYSEDLPKLIEVIKNTRADCLTVRFHNLTDENDESVYIIHEGLRMGYIALKALSTSNPRLTLLIDCR